MYKLFMQLKDADEFTRAEVVRFVELKLDEATKIRGQIAKDLRRIGTDAFRDARAYRKLKEKYLRSHQSRKKLAILELERRTWCISC